MVICFSKIKKILVAVSLLFITVTCNKDSYQNFPNVSVNITLSIATDLSSLGSGTAIICPYPGGVKGIIISQPFPGEYVAFDRLCTNYPNDTCAIVLETPGGIIADCPCCQSKFVLTDGTVSQGPARFALREYSVYVDGNHLYIRN